MLAENDSKRRRVLERLQSEMEQIDIEGRVVKKGEEGSGFDILVCNLSDIPGLPGGITGNYFFPDGEAAENVFYFTCMVTIKENLSKEEEDKIRGRLDEINLGLACGMFAVYPEIGLVYKLSYPVSEGLDEDALFEMIDIAASHSVVFVRAYAEKLLD